MRTSSALPWESPLPSWHACCQSTEVDMALSAKAKPLHRKSARRLIWMHCPNAARWDAKCQWHDGAHAGAEPPGDDASRCRCGRGRRGRLRTRHTARDGSIRCGSARGDDERRHPAGTAGPARTSGTRAHRGADVRQRLVRLGRTRRRRHQLGDRAAARSDAAAATRHRPARQGRRRRRGDGGRCGAGSRAGGRRGPAAVRGGGRRRRRRLLAQPRIR